MRAPCLCDGPGHGSGRKAYRKPNKTSCTGCEKYEGENSTGNLKY